MSPDCNKRKNNSRPFFVVASHLRAVVAYARGLYTKYIHEFSINVVITFILDLIS